jgi:hypothetical protein
MQEYKCEGKLDFSDVKSKIAEFKENKRLKATEKLKQFREQTPKSFREYQNY